MLGVTHPSEALIMNLGSICKVALETAQQLSKRYCVAVRNNDIVSPRTRLKGSDVSLRANHGALPLIYVSVAGSLDHAAECAL